MLCTKDIKTGDQIVCRVVSLPRFLTDHQWNTYADPPNSDLLRRYGHVDVLPMGDGQGGNPADVVELRADTVIDACGLMKDDLMGRIEWWLDIGEDE
jgi:N-lysine methyltransferase SETD6